MSVGGFRAPTLVLRHYLQMAQNAPNPKQAYNPAMKRLAALALLLSGIAIPVCAFASAAHGGSVHGSGGHAGFTGQGGFSSHSAPAFHSGFRSTAPFRSQGFPRYGGVRPSYPARSFPMGRPEMQGTRPGYGYNRPGQLRYPNSPYRPPYRGGYGYRAPYNYGRPGWYGYGFLGYPYLYDDFSDYGDSQAPYDDGQNYDAGPQYPDQDPHAGPWQPEPVQPAPRPEYQPSSLPPGESAVTLVFKDGRPPEQIRNYILSRDKISVWDQHPREIPISQLDLVATEKLNREAGVDFQLPDTPR